MKSANDFAKASPDQKIVMIIDGALFLSKYCDTMATQLGILNQWVETVPSLIDYDRVNMQDHTRLLTAFKQLSDNIDKLTEQMVINAQNDDKVKRFINRQMVRKSHESC